MSLLNVNNAIEYKDKENYLYIGRKSEGLHYGNPFSSKKNSLASLLVGTNEESVDIFESWLRGLSNHQIEQNRRLWILGNILNNNLNNKTLVCYDHGNRCHGEILLKIKEEYLSMRTKYPYSRFSDNCYELSSKGDRRFSAFYAQITGKCKRLEKIITAPIEWWYQSEMKGFHQEPTYSGYRQYAGKGKPKLPNSYLDGKDSYKEYLKLWKRFAQKYPELIEELALSSKGKVLTDMFADSYVSQARALSDILNEKYPNNIIFQEDISMSYASRTRKNIELSDMTIAIAVDFFTAGEKLTKGYSIKMNKPFLALPYDPTKILEQSKIIVDMMVEFGVKSLNIAGNDIYTLNNYGITQEEVDGYSFELLRNVKNKYYFGGRSGGQTGVDESGAKALNWLGLDATVLAPKGWKYRTKINDVSNEKLFKYRF